jgi:hypothetical protein
MFPAVVPGAGNSQGVGMKQCAATNSLDPVRWLWSGGAEDCVIVAAYAHGKAFIVHVDAITDDGDWLSELSKVMKGAAMVTVYMVSGAVGNNPNGLTITRVRDVLQRFENKWNLQPAINSRSFAIDARTGQTLTAFNVAGLPIAPLNTGLALQTVYWQLGGATQSKSLQALLS